MPTWELSSSLYLDFTAGPEGRRPIRARRRPPAGRGERFAVPADRVTRTGAQAFVVFRPGARMVVLGARADRDAAEELRARLGPSASRYEIAAVPVEAG